MRLLLKNSNAARKVLFYALFLQFLSGNAVTKLTVFLLFVIFRQFYASVSIGGTRSVEILTSKLVYDDLILQIAFEFFWTRYEQGF